MRRWNRNESDVTRLGSSRLPHRVDEDLGLPPDEIRAERRNVVAWVILALLAVAAIAAIARVEITPEVTLEPVTVQMADPIPCERDPEVRRLYVELGVTCRGGGR